MIKKLFTTCCLILTMYFVCAQSLSLDSLRHKLALHPSADTIRINLLNALAAGNFDYNVNELGAYSRQALVLSQKIGYQKGEASAYLNLGTWFTLVTGDTAALRYLHQAQLLFTRLHDREGLIRVANMTGCYYATIKDLANAGGYFARALEMLGKNDSPLSLPVLNNMGSYLEDTGQPDKAVKYYYRVLQSAIRFKNPDYVASSYQNIASVHFRHGRLSRSLALSEQGLNYASVNSVGPRSKQYLYLLEGDIYTRMKEWASARTAYSRVLALAGDMRTYENRASAFKGLYQLDSAEHHYFAALNAHLSYDRFKDSLLNREHIRVAALYRFKSAMEEQLMTNQQLVLSNEQKSSQISRQQLLLIITVLLLTVITAGFFYLRRIYRQLKLRNLTILDQNQLLETNDKVKDQLFSVIAHDLRSPLAQVVNMLDLLAENDLDQQELQEVLPAIKKSTQNTITTMDNLLQWSKNQLRGFVYHPQQLDLYGIAVEKLAKMELAASKKSLKIVNQVDRSAIVFADREMVTIIFRNLLTNAIKFTPVGGTIRLESKLADDYWVISIEDSGVGMSAHRLNNLFLSNVSTLGTEQEKGTGLGLKLCKEFAEMNGGKLWVTSKEGEGSCFSFTLPMVRK